MYIVFLSSSGGLTHRQGMIADFVTFIALMLGACLMIMMIHKMQYRKKKEGQE